MIHMYMNVKSIVLVVRRSCSRSAYGATSLTCSCFCLVADWLTASEGVLLSLSSRKRFWSSICSIQKGLLARSLGP